MLDLTKGSIKKNIIIFAWPVFLQYMLQVTYNIIDTIWVGRLGKDAIASISISFSIIFVLLSVIIGFAISATIMIAQYRGAKQPQLIDKTATNLFVVVGFIVLVISAAGVLFTKPILRLLATPPDIEAMSASYLRIILGGMIFMFLFNSASAVLRGLGDSKTPMKIMFVSTVLNIVLDPLFIFGIWIFPKMNVSGAAVATIISQSLAAIIIFWYIKRNKHKLNITFRHFTIDFNILKKIFTLGIPMAIQQLGVSVGGLVLIGIVNKFGSTVIAAFGIGQKLNTLIIMPSIAISMAVTSIVGQNIGAHKFKRVYETARDSWIISFAVSIFITTILVILIKPLLHLFIPNIRDFALVLPYAESYVYTMALAYPLFGPLFTNLGILRGAGDTIATMIIVLIVQLLIRVPLALLLIKTAAGIHGVWIAMAISIYIGTALSFLYFFFGKWLKKRLV